MVDFLAALLTLFSLPLILFGAFFAVSAPADGQTGFMVWPAWYLGLPMGAAGLILSFFSELKMVRWGVWLGSVINVAALYLSYRACAAVRL